MEVTGWSHSWHLQRDDLGRKKKGRGIDGVGDEKKWKSKNETSVKVGERPGWFHLFHGLVLNQGELAQ